MAKNGKSSLKIENQNLIAKHFWKGVNKALNTSIFKTSFKGKSGDNNRQPVRKTYGMLLESAGNSTIKIGRSFSIHYLKQDFIDRVKGEYARVIREEKNKIIDEGKKYQRIQELTKERHGVIKKLERTDFNGKINNLNNWLERRCPSKKFIEKDGSNYRLLIYRVIGPKNKSKLFCSKYYSPAFNNQIHIETTIQKEINLRVEKIYHLQTLEQYLEKGFIANPEFFRKVGPLWIDFEKNYVSKSKLVDEIFNNIDKYQFHFLVGNSASGKTTIARNIGYELFRRGWSVYNLSPSSFEIADIKTLVDEIVPLESDNKTLIILDDIHKNLSDVIYLLKRIIQLKRIKYLLIGTSHTIDSIRENIIFDNYRIWEIDKRLFLDVSCSIGHDYIWKKYENSQSKKSAISIDFKQFIDTADKITNCNFWIFTYLLKAWNIERINYCIEMKNVYDEVKKDIEKLNNTLIEKYNLDDCIKTLLVLSPFSIYEIGVPEIFLKDVFNINLKTLRKLIKLGEVECQNGLYVIPHSSLAQLYLETLMFGDYNYDYLLKEFRKYLDNSVEDIEQIPSGIIKSFLRTSPKNYGDIIRMMCYHEYNSLFLKCGLYYLYDMDKTEVSISIKDILFDNKTKTALIKSIHEGDLKNFIIFLDGIRIIKKHSSLLCKIEEEEVAEFFEKIDINNLVSKIKNEPCIKNVMCFFDRLLYFKIRKFHREILKEINIHDLNSSIINSELNFEDTVRLICSVWVIDNELVDILKNTLIEKFKCTINLEDIHTGLKVLNVAEKEIKSKEVMDIIKYLSNLIPKKKYD